MISIKYDEGDEALAFDLENRLAGEIGLLLPSDQDRPEIRTSASLDDLPGPADVGPLDVILRLLPPSGKALPPEESAWIRDFRARKETTGLLLPVSTEPARNLPPEPIADLVSFRVEDWGHGALAALVLNRAGHRLREHERTLLISYRIRDGKPWAETLEAGLRARNFDVWRDELADRDGIPRIDPGSPAQRTIRDAIGKRNLVLVVDTPEAPESKWVHEEIDTALGVYQLPVLPVVVMPQGERNPGLGGRFRQLREFQRECRAPHTPTKALDPSALDATFFDVLEAMIVDKILAHRRSRLTLIDVARRQLEAIGFQWEPVDEGRSLYLARLDCDADETPCLCLRLLVLCTPHEVVIEDVVNQLNAFRRQNPDRPHQFGVLVPRHRMYPADRRRLLKACEGHLLLLSPDELGSLPSAFRFRSLLQGAQA